METKREKTEFLWGYLFIFPTMLGLIVLNILPIFHIIYQSFFKNGDFGNGNIFVGLNNYKEVLADGEVIRALFNTILYTLLEVPISIIIALILAVFLNRELKGRSIYRTIIFIPMVASPAAISIVFRWLYNTDYGLINNIFHLHVKWLSDPNLALFSVASIGIWSIIGYNMVLFLAGLQEIPRDYYEAAQIDGATGLKRFFYVTLPLLSPSIFFVLITRVIGAMQVFDVIFMVMDKTNPALKNTQSLVFLFYKYSFTNKNIGYGSTIVVLLLIITIFITILQILGQKKWVFYN